MSCKFTRRSKIISRNKASAGLMGSLTKFEQRRLRFSKDANARILGDPLCEKSLISRGSNLQVLQRDQAAREELLSRIKSSNDDSALDHGLRKLREVIVSVFAVNEKDAGFIALVQEVYQLSYGLFLKQNDIIKLGNLVLSFIFHHFPNNTCSQQLYALHASHVGADLSKCIHILTYNGSSITSEERQLIRISSIYLVNLESPSQWFYILSRLPENQQRLLMSSPAFLQMKERCLQYIQKCYNQIPLDYLLKSWFYNMVGNSDLPSNWSLQSTGNVQTFFLKKRTKT